MSNSNITSSANQAATPEAVPASANNKQAHRILVFVSCALCIASWCILVWSNGYAAICAAALSITAGFIGAAGNSTAYKRIATTSIIASTVLLLVVAAYLMVLKFGLGV